MTIDECVKYLREALDSVKPNVHTEFRMSPQEVEQLLYWLTEYRAMISGRHSDNLSERLAEHLVWAESNSYECPVTLAEDLQEAISDLNDKGKTISNLIENIKCLQGVSSWIPCNERLPEQYEEVLIYCPGFCEAIKKANFNDGYFHVERSDLAVKAGKFCTHWSPIPQPPKEVHHDEN